MRLAGLCGMREFKEIKKCGKVLNDMGSIVFFDKDTELEVGVFGLDAALSM